MSDDYSKEIRNAEIIAGVLAITLWPIGVVVDGVTNLSLLAPAMTVTAFAWIGGRTVFSDFGNFTKAYAAAGLTFGLMTYLDRQAIMNNLTYEEQKVQGTALRTAQRIGTTNLTQWCAPPPEKRSMGQNIICAMDLTQFGIKSK